MPPAFDPTAMLADIDAGCKDPAELARRYGVSKITVYKYARLTGRLFGRMQTAAVERGRKQVVVTLARRVRALSPEARAEFDRLVREGE